MNIISNTSLRSLLENNNSVPILGCHDALSAMIGEKAGFKALWASSLGLSTVHGRRDAGELCWSEIVSQVENIAEATSVPLLVDGDNGHGDYNIARLFAKKLCKIGVSGISIEDQVFPKRNSFIEANQELEEIGSFCSKITAIKDSLGTDFLVAGRVEALIVGRCVDFALERAHAYVDAGADAIIIHSKSSDALDVSTFIRSWKRTTPLILIPTTYHKAFFTYMAKLKVGAVVWANQMLRYQVSALQKVATKLLSDQNLDTLTPMASLKDIFSLTGIDNLPSEELHFKKEQEK